MKAPEALNRLISEISKPNSFLFWLLIVSAVCFLFERLFPWRKHQKWNRPEFTQDLFFLFFNAQLAGIMLGVLAVWFVNILSAFIPVQILKSVQLLKKLPETPWILTFFIALIIKDFIEWNVHRQLHKRSFLWEFHKLHHTIRELDWIGNFRFHWMEIVFYKIALWIPLAILGVDAKTALAVAVFSLSIGHLNHSNLNISWGPLRYIFNSPRMHVWHHDVDMHYPYGQNFAIVFSAWDWIFRTAWLPKDKSMPDKLGFKGDESFPKRLFKRLVYPLGVSSGT